MAVVAYGAGAVVTGLLSGVGAAIVGEGIVHAVNEGRNRDWTQASATAGVALVWLAVFLVCRKGSKACYQKLTSRVKRWPIDPKRFNNMQHMQRSLFVTGVVVGIWQICQGKKSFGA